MLLSNIAVIVTDTVLDREVVTSPPLLLHSIAPDSEDPLPDRKQLLANEHKALAYSLACTDNVEYFCYVSASGHVQNYYNHGMASLSLCRLWSTRFGNLSVWLLGFHRWVGKQLTSLTML